MTPAGIGGTSPAATAAMHRSKHSNPCAMAPTSISDLPSPIIVNAASSRSPWRSAIARTSSNRCTASAGFPLPSCATAGASRTNPASAPGSSIASTIRIARAAQRTLLVKSPSSMSWSESHPAERAAPAVSSPVRCASYARVQASTRPAVPRAGSRRSRAARGRMPRAPRSRRPSRGARRRPPSAAPRRPRGPHRVRWTRSCGSHAGRAPSEPAPAPVIVRERYRRSDGLRKGARRRRAALAAIGPPRTLEG